MPTGHVGSDSRRRVLVQLDPVRLGRREDLLPELRIRIRFGGQQAQANQGAGAPVAALEPGSRSRSVAGAD